jgi:hypothetical protein
VASQRGGLGSIPGQFKWDLCWTKWNRGMISLNDCVFSCQYHSTIAPYSFIHLPHTLYNVFLPVLQFSPVSIIPPLLHTHPFIYHPGCIMIFSQYFNFPLSVSFHHCSILIHLPPTLYNVFLPVLQFSPVSIITQLLHTHPSIYHPHCIMFFSHTSVSPVSIIPPSLHTFSCLVFDR